VPDELFNQTQLEMGRKVEMEHTTDPDTADCIAKHHLLEEAEARGLELSSPKLRYYTDLEKMEHKWKRRGTGAWVSEAATSKTAKGVRTVEGIVDTNCKGLVVHKSTCDKDRSSGKFLWVVTHKGSGESVLRTTSKGDAKRMAAALCKEIKQCPGFTWENTSEELSKSGCVYSAAIRAQEKVMHMAMIRRVKQREKEKQKREAKKKKKKKK
jgi:hypothetical protein